MFVSMFGGRKLLVFVFVLAATAVGCSSNTGEASPAVLQGETISTTTTVAVVESTTTTAATTTTETTEATVVVSEYADMERPELEIQTEWDSDLDEIFARHLMYWDALAIAKGPPFADPDYQPLLDVLDPGVIEQAQAQIQRVADANAIVVVPEDSLADHGLRLPNPSVLTKTEGNRVVIQNCRIRDDLTVFLDGSPGYEHFETLLLNVDMIVVDGEWKTFAVTEADDRSDGYHECQDLFETLEK